ncbi:MAG: histidine kinase dimerization/phospho-acceptor domain-containing protein, partial [Caldibacillus sp.]
MKFKYLYQQMLSHLTIILLAFIAIGVVMSQFVENLIFQNKSEELISYGENILEDLGFNFYRNYQILNQYQNILNERDIFLSVFDADGDIRFPDSQKNMKRLFTRHEWESLQQGKKIVINVDIKRFDQAVSLVVIPFIRDDYFLGGILLTSPVSGTRELVHQFNRYMIYTGIVVALASALLSVVSSNILVRRIKLLQQATSSIARGEYDVVVPESDFDEIGVLAGNFRKMAEQLRKSAEEVERSEKRRRQFMADVSHEMRTPLTTISGLVEGLKNDMIPEEEKEKALDLVNKEAKRLIRLVNENLDYEKIRSNQVTLNKE